MPSPRGWYPRRLPQLTLPQPAPVSVSPSVLPPVVVRAEDTPTPAVVLLVRPPLPATSASSPRPQPIAVVRGDDPPQPGFTWLARPPGPAPVVSGPLPRVAQVVRSADPDVPGYVWQTRPQPSRVQPQILPPRVVRSDYHVDGQAQLVRSPSPARIQPRLLPATVLRFEPPQELLAGYVCHTPIPPPAAPAPPSLTDPRRIWLESARVLVWVEPDRRLVWQDSDH